MDVMIYFFIELPCRKWDIFLQKWGVSRRCFQGFIWWPLLPCCFYVHPSKSTKLCGQIYFISILAFTATLYSSMIRLLSWMLQYTNEIEAQLSFICKCGKDHWKSSKDEEAIIIHQVEQTIVKPNYSLKNERFSCPVLLKLILSKYLATGRGQKRLTITTKVKAP